jgi:hypothetical protein
LGSYRRRKQAEYRQSAEIKMLQWDEEDLRFAHLVKEKIGLFKSG